MSKKEYTVTYSVIRVVEQTVKAESLEDALELAKDYATGVSNRVKVARSLSYLDGSIEVLGVSDVWPT